MDVTSARISESARWFISRSVSFLEYSQNYVESRAPEAVRYDVIEMDRADESAGNQPIRAEGRMDVRMICQ